MGTNNRAATQKPSTFSTGATRSVSTTGLYLYISHGLFYHADGKAFKVFILASCRCTLKPGRYALFAGLATILTRIGSAFASVMSCFPVCEVYDELRLPVRRHWEMGCYVLKHVGSWIFPGQIPSWRRFRGIIGERRSSNPHCESPSTLGYFTTV